MAWKSRALPLDRDAVASGRAARKTVCRSMVAVDLSIGRDGSSGLSKVDDRPQVQLKSAKTRLKYVDAIHGAKMNGFGCLSETSFRGAIPPARSPPSRTYISTHVQETLCYQNHYITNIRAFKLLNSYHIDDES